MEKILERIATEPMTEKDLKRIKGGFRRSYIAALRKGNYKECNQILSAEEDFINSERKEIK